nr:thiamine-phosphate kinase [Caulobacter sp. S45]
MGDEFDHIARDLRPLTFGAPEALDLLDDAAVIPSRPGFDLVVTKDAMVAGVHFLPDDPLDLVARKQLRVNLSDLAAKAAEPYGYFLAIAWPHGTGEGARALFAAGLEADQRRFGLKLFGGDTVSTPGPLTLSATLLGWVPAGAMVRRAGARPGDRVLVSGVIGDGGLGLRAALGTLADASPEDCAALAERYRLPEPRLALRQVLRRCASAAADVSDGLLADAGHVARASGVGMRLDLDRLLLSSAAQAWLMRQDDLASALAELASLGDDYEVVLTTAADRAHEAVALAAEGGVALTDIGEVVEGEGIAASFRGEPLRIERMGWTHQ